MLIRIPDLLSADEVATFRETLERAAWQDGRETAGDQAATVKNNLQIPPDSAVARELGGSRPAHLGAQCDLHRRGPAAAPPAADVQPLRPA